MCSGANRTDVCLWKRASFIVHSQMLGLWISMHPTSVPQTMRNQLSPAFSFMTCHSSCWDNWPGCKTVIGTPVSESWNVVFTDEEENEFQRWFFFVSQQGFLFQAERDCFTEFLSCHDLARTRFCRRVHYNTDLWQHSAAVAPKETQNPWDVGDPGCISFKWHFMWHMPCMLLYYTCSDPLVSECCINYYWKPPNGIKRVKPFLSLILILSAQTLVWQVWNGSATFTLVQWQNPLWIIKNFLKCLHNISLIEIHWRWDIFYLESTGPITRNCSIICDLGSILVQPFGHNEA